MQKIRVRLVLFVNRFLDLFSSRQCQSCKKAFASKNRFLCNECYDSLKIDFSDSIKNLDEHNIFFASLYQNQARKLIKECKYRSPLLAEFWAYLLAEYWQSNLENILSLYGLKQDKSLKPKINFYITEVPLHKNKQRQRGYNQSQLIAKAFSRILSLSHLPEFLIKTKYRSSLFSQTKLERELLLSNSVKMGCAINKVPKSHSKFSNILIIIDDIATTGSTFKECIHSLQTSKAFDKIIPISCTGRKINL